MSYQLNKTLQGLTPYEPIAGSYQIRLDANESFFPLPDEFLKQAALDAPGDRMNRYPDPYAVRACGAFARLYDVRPELVTAGNGSDELISLLVGAFFGSDEELVTLAMDFSMYRFYAEALQKKVSVFPKRDDLTIDTAALAEYINRSGARGLIFSNPCNPTSLCLDRRRVLALVRAVPDCLVVVDEAYMDFADESVLGQAEKLPNLLVLRTCSKALGLAGIRLGFAVANPELTNALRAVKSPYNVNLLTQSIAARVMENGEYVTGCVERVIRSRDRLFARMMALLARHRVFEQVYPTATNFVFVKTARAGEIWERLRQRSIAVRCFDGYLRISAGSNAENEAVVAALAEIATELEQE